MRADAKKNYDQILGVARDLLATGGADASLRDVARTAGVGLGTMYRHFRTREALLEALLRTSFDRLGIRAGELERTGSSDAALVAWLREVIALAHRYSGAIRSMVAAIEDEDSALHASCVAMKDAGTRLLLRAQAEGTVRSDLDGADLFALVGALAWVTDQPVLTQRSDHIFMIITDAILAKP
ncbi:TetR/AcrR family transcriptional regulator [uncultured Sphingomonas sp.]|uniref:TetR/AcrR family transcriptional regulator n=1 Tax=uncultured Sphingomonas sp. TaxID=158754 RepID=UPI0035CBC40D